MEDLSWVLNTVYKNGRTQPALRIRMICSEGEDSNKSANSGVRIINVQCINLGLLAKGYLLTFGDYLFGAEGVNGFGYGGSDGLDADCDQGDQKGNDSGADEYQGINTDPIVVLL